MRLGSYFGSNGAFELTVLKRVSWVRCAWLSCDRATSTEHQAAGRRQEAVGSGQQTERATAEAEAKDARETGQGIAGREGRWELGTGNWEMGNGKWESADGDAESGR